MIKLKVNECGDKTSTREKAMEQIQNMEEERIMLNKIAPELLKIFEK